MRETRGARRPNLQVVITHASHVCSQLSFGLPLMMNGMHRTHFDHVRLDLLSLVIWSRVFWPYVPWNSRKASAGAKAFWPSVVVACTLQPLVITSNKNKVVCLTWAAFTALMLLGPEKCLKQRIQIKLNRQTSWLFTNAIENLNSGTPWTNPASG